MNREQLEAEYDRMISRINDMTSQNEKIISRSTRIIEASKPSDDEETTRPEARSY